MINCIYSNAVYLLLPNLCMCVCITGLHSFSFPTVGDPVSISLDKQREWDEAIRLFFYNQEKELLLHGKQHAHTYNLVAIVK